MSQEPPTRPPVRGQIAALVNERELVINRGLVHGVQRGMKFKVLAQDQLEVRDPAGGGFLGNVSRIKVRVQAEVVEPTMTICRTYEAIRGARGIGLAADMMAPPQYRTLRSGDQAYLPPLDEKDSYVKIGDPFEEIQDD